MLYLVPPESVLPDHIFQVRTEICGPPAKYCGSDSEIYCPPLKYFVPHGSKYFNRNVSSPQVKYYAPLYNMVNYSAVLY